MIIGRIVMFLSRFDRLDELFGPGQWEKFLEAFATYHERSSEDGGISI